MDREYLPDLQDDDVLATTSYGFKSSQCNGLAYDPTTVYKVPVNYDGSSRGAGATSDYAIASQFGSYRNLNDISSRPTAGSTITVRVTNGSRQSSWYPNNQAVTIYGDVGTFIVGYVPTSGSNWNTSNGDLKVTVVFATGTFPLTDVKIATGTPTKNVYYTYTGAQTAMNYSYVASGAVVKNDFFNECDTAADHKGNTKFRPVYAATSVTVPNSTISDAQNFANWQKHYKSRMLTMKAGVSLAFRDLDAKYRIGLTTLSSKNVTESDDFLDIRDFDNDPLKTVTTRQKWKFYDKLWKATPPSNQSTPLRAALAKVGQYYAKKAIVSGGGNQTYDPIQYSCQRNYAILSTDGYWNTYNEATSSPKYGPYQLDRTTLVGQQDGGGNGTKRPMFDGGSVTKTTEERWTRTEKRYMRVDTPA
ncbi:hypothetical protein HK414_03265 [Ramlibacter terrae]|uniref:Uncharacterized protein n=1 Tax=Ramlibacter terrae TaxID=2732511 RepID=A0ABX6P320_9BURK|nr:hypothetical protein HK414_03265 [Ramlibacter terrae]